MRIDVYLFKENFIESRTLAAETIRKGWVRVDGTVIKRPSFIVDESIPHAIEIAFEELCPYVSRGGLKLEKAIENFKLVLDGKLVLDIGASTGGFTDCALKKGAAQVWAIDVGTSQLHKSLRVHSQVISLEDTDIRALEPERAGIPPVDVITCDVSFISLKHIIPHLTRFLKKDGCAVLLIKPQFEAGPTHLGKAGLVKDKKVHQHVIQNIANWLQLEGFHMNKLTYAPLQGKHHNIEYLALASGGDNILWSYSSEIIEEAFKKNGW